MVPVYNFKAHTYELFKTFHIPVLACVYTKENNVYCSDVKI